MRCSSMPVWWAMEEQSCISLSKGPHPRRTMLRTPFSLFAHLLATLATAEGSTQMGKCLLPAWNSETSLSGKGAAAQPSLV